ncbi:MAG: cytochrome P450 [Alphaproteobacteria bacterium]|nr:cytochrome P450 [Alphaproteobacteria bacterium]
MNTEVMANAVVADDGRIPRILDLELLDQEPHRVFRQLRPLYPCVEAEFGTLIVLRSRDVEALFTDPRTRQFETEPMALRGITEGPLYDIFRYGMVFSNGAVHQRRRAPLARAFAHRMMEAMRPTVAALANRLIDEVKADGEMDLLEHYSATIPAHTVCSILGVPEEDIPHFFGWAKSTARGISWFRDEDFPEINRTAGEMIDYVARTLDDRRKAPREDFLTQYVKMTEEAGELSPEEIVIQIAGLILAGSDTTRTGITATLSLLLQHKEQWKAVLADESLLSAAVNEGIRFDPPVGAVPRVTLEPVELDGYTINPGQVILLSLVSSLRDPAAYSDPERFDISRTDHPRWHLAFGSGPHRCIGEALARVEMEEALRALGRRLPGLEIVGAPPKVTGHNTLRKIDQMRVGWTR